MRVYDVSVPVSEVMPVWSGNPRVKIEQLFSIADGDHANVPRLSLGCHTGTHVDAHYSLVGRGPTIEQLPLDVPVCPAFVVDVDGQEANTISVFYLACLHLPRDVTRLLIKTSNSHFWEDRLTKFERGFVQLGPKTAEWLVRRGIRLVGVDYRWNLSAWRSIACMPLS